HLFLLSFPTRRSSDLVEWLGAHVIRELCLVEGLGPFDRLAENLKIGVGKGRQIPAERINPFGGRLGLIFLQEIHDARELHLRRGDRKSTRLNSSHSQI